MLITKPRGFTLLEILVALFIFTILSMLLATSLRRLLDVEAGLTRHGEALHELQIALFLLSQDIEASVNRPVWQTNGQVAPAVVGSSVTLSFTQTSDANPVATYPRGTLRRRQYAWHDGALWRQTAAVLDEAAGAKRDSRCLLHAVSHWQFDYLDEDGKFHDHWPISAQDSLALPRAVRIRFTLAHWGAISQLYVISAKSSLAAQVYT